MKKTLLQKAQEPKKRKLKNIPKQVEDLVLAWLKDEINIGQYASGMGKTYGAGLYSDIARTCKKLYSQKRLTLK